jgi:uncharacterized integral membrane protein
MVYFCYIRIKHMHKKFQVMKEKKNRTWFWILYGIIAVLLIIFIFQNIKPVELQFLIIDIKGPIFLVFLVIFFLGFAGGWAWEYFRRTRKENLRHRQKEEQTRRIEPQ